jgi:hypothetical protein
MTAREKLIYEALAKAAMCWSRTPSGCFDIKRCKEIAEELITALDLDTKIKQSEYADWLFWRLRGKIDDTVCAQISNELSERLNKI